MQAELNLLMHIGTSPFQRPLTHFITFFPCNSYPPLHENNLVVGFRRTYRTLPFLKTIFEQVRLLDAFTRNLKYHLITMRLKRFDSINLQSTNENKPQSITTIINKTTEFKLDIITRIFVTSKIQSQTNYEAPWCCQQIIYALRVNFMKQLLQICHQLGMTNLELHSRITSSNVIRQTFRLECTLQYSVILFPLRPIMSYIFVAHSSFFLSLIRTQFY